MAVATEAREDAACPWRRSDSINKILGIMVDEGTLQKNYKRITECIPVVVYTCFGMLQYCNVLWTV